MKIVQSIPAAEKQKIQHDNKIRKAAADKIRKTGKKLAIIFG